MSLSSKIAEDLKAAMLARDSLRVETLKGLKSAILYEEVALKKRDTGLNDDEITAVLKREAKKRQDAITLYEKGGNESMAAKEQDELNLLKVYLPEVMSEEKTVEVVDQVLKNLGIDKPQKSDIGKIIGAVKASAGSSADPATIAKVVNQKIG